MERIVEHEYISKRANDERQKRPNYRSVIEHDGLLLHQTQNQIDVLLRRLYSSYTSWADKNEAGKEICYLTKHSEYARAHFGETPNSFDPLFDILWYKDMDEHPDLREHLVTTFYNISLDGRYKKKLFLDMDLTRTKIGFHLGRNLVHGTIESRRIAAATISSIYAAAADDDDHDSSISEMKYFEGSKFLNGLISLLEYGDDLAAKDAITAIIKLCIFPYNRLCVVNRGIIRLILEKLSRGILVDELLDLLDSLSPEWRTVAIEELVNKSKKAVPLLFGMLKNNNNNISEVKKQQCLSVLVKMCKYDDQGTTLMELKKEIVKLLDLKNNNNNNEDISEVIKKDQCLSILLEMCKNGEGTTLKEIVELDLKNNEDITAKAT